MWADNLRFFSILTVVILHVSGGFVGGIDISSTAYGSESWWAGNIFDSISRWCVPVLVMISGYFILNREEENTVFIKKRINRIFIPLIFWSLFYSFWTIINIYIFGELSLVDIKSVIVSLIFGEPYYHLWYLFMIPFLYVLTPLLRLVLKFSTKQELLFYITFCFIMASVNVIYRHIFYSYLGTYGVDLFINKFLGYIGYFVLGGYIGRFNPKVNVKICLMLLIASWFVTIVASYYYGYLYFYDYLSFNTIVASITCFLISRHILEYGLGLEASARFSFGIYLIHPFVLDLISLTVKEDITTRISIYLYIPLVSLFTFVVSYMLVAICYKNSLLRRCL
mgnify:CR=1 FL=1